MELPPKAPKQNTNEDTSKPVKIKSIDGPLEVRQEVLAKRRERVRNAKEETRQRIETAPNSIIVDLAFLDCMEEKAIKSLALQILVMASYMRVAANPFSIHLAQYDEKTSFASAMVKAAYGEPLTPEGCMGLRFHSSSLKDLLVKEKRFCAPQEVIYMSPDADEILQDIQPGQSFVIGGIVDGTRKKFLSRDQAQKVGVRCRRLPIQEYLTPTRDCVLNVNDVGELLSLYSELRDWARVFDRFLQAGKNTHRFKRKAPE